MDKKLPTILIVEDNTSHLMFIGGILKDEGYTVREAKNIDDALRQIEELAQDNLIVTIDVEIPRLSGDSTDKKGGIKLWEQLHKQKIPTILLTAHSERDDVIGMKNNVTIVEKPLKKKALLKAVRKITNHSERDDVIDIKEQYKVPIVPKILKAVRKITKLITR